VLGTSGFDLVQLIVGLLLAVGVSLLAGRAGALSDSGMAAAVVVGGLTFGLGGWVPALLLIAFFASSSGLSKWGAAHKRRLADKFSKGARRDWAQVAANGGVAALAAAAYGIGLGTSWLAAAAGSLAAATADTWATELGVLYGANPRRITDWRPSEPGTSGAISWQGSLAALVGAGLLGGLGAWCTGETALAVSGIVGGLAGASLDSLLGASVQAQFYCPACAKRTEHSPTHTCGTPTRQVSGWRWLANDGVNALATLAGGLTGLLLYHLLAG
jgi:uncharacterized protein (TIGR00297 family)